MVLRVALAVSAGQRIGAPAILQILFSGWVLTPFVLLRAALGWSSRKPALITRTLETIAPVVTAFSTALAGVDVVERRPLIRTFVSTTTRSRVIVGGQLVQAFLRSPFAAVQPRLES